MTLNDILEMDVDQILHMAHDNPKELRAVTARLGAATQKRTKRLIEKLGSDGLPYVTERFIDTGGYKGIRGKGTPQLVTEYQRLRAYLLNPGTTLKGQQDYAREFAERVGLPSGTSYQTTAKIIRTLDRLKERNPDLFQTVVDSEEVVDMLHQEAEKDPEADVDKLTERTQKKLDELYREEMTKGGDISDFFDGGGDKFAI